MRQRVIIKYSVRRLWCCHHDKIAAKSSASSSHECNSWCWTFISVCKQPPRPTQPSIPQGR